jgi:putative tricarboxylic transport membrane protein
MTGIDHFLQALHGFLGFETVINVFAATLAGIVIGALPGLTATMGVALLTTLTYSMPAEQAMLSLICMYVGAIYGGSRSAILLNIPGTPANAATTLDGFPLVKSGQAGYAMGIATTASALGTLIGILGLILVAPTLAELALSFQSYEYFWLAVFGIVIAGLMTAASDPLKGWIAGVIGLLCAMVGQESVHAYERFSFGSTELAGGFGLIPVLVGVFGLAEVLTVMRNVPAELVTTTVDRVLPRFADIWRYKWTILRSGVLGTGVGIIPGVGEDIGAWVSYAAAKRSSKEPDMFGKGSIEGPDGSATETIQIYGSGRSGGGASDANATTGLRLEQSVQRNVTVGANGEKVETTTTQGRGIADPSQLSQRGVVKKVSRPSGEGETVETNVYEQGVNGALRPTQTTVEQVKK